MDLCNASSRFKHLLKCHDTVIPTTLEQRGNIIYKKNRVEAVAPCNAVQKAIPCGRLYSTIQRRSQPLCKAINGSASVQPSSIRFQQVIAKIDELNSKDPRTVEVDGKQVPYELAYSQWLTDWVLRLTKDSDAPASEELLIVARGQHVQRWTSPRGSYPEGKAGYFKWREDLKKFHAATVTGIMRIVGYPEESRDRVESMILKKALKTDPENQIVEDALCLVFLEHQFRDLRLKEGDDKMVDILHKTWKKIGPKGREAALSLELAPEEKTVVVRALSQ